MNDFSSMWLSLDVHRDKVNKIIKEFREADKKNKERYSDSFYQEQHKELVEKYKEKIAGEKDRVTDTINTYIENMQDTLQKWIAAPLPESRLNLLNLIMGSGLKLNRAEFEVLSGYVGNNYFGRKILSALAEKEGIHIESTPDISVYERLLKDCISSADVFISGFYGTMPEWELVPSNTSKYVVNAAAAGSPIKDGCALHKAALFWDGSSVPCSKTKISSEDREILQKLYSGCNDDNAKATRTKELLSETPELKETLELTEYKQYISEE